MVSILILTIGLVGTAALMSSSVNMGAHARYVSTAALLASEKMEDLDRFPDNDPNLAAGRQPGRDITGYSDSVQISTANGNINETTTAKGVTTLYTQKPDGTVVMTPGGDAWPPRRPTCSRSTAAGRSLPTPRSAAM